MNRSRYLAAVGAAALGAAAGCSTVRQELADRQAGVGFEFPEGVGTDGVTAPETVSEYPQFDTEWQADGRVLELTNAGGGPVVGERPDGQLNAMEFDFGDSSAWGERVEWRSLERLTPGETGYLYVDGGPVLAPSPPDDTASLRAIRGEEPPRFRYQYEEEDDAGPYELLYDTSCDGLDC